MTNAETVALLPCPFCGSQDVDPRGWASKNSAGPGCNDCGGSAGGAAHSVEENASAWNRRAAKPAPVVTDEMVERACISHWWWWEDHGHTDIKFARSTQMRAAITAALTPRDDAGEAE